jgi:hypothetical protein
MHWSIYLVLLCRSSVAVLALARRSSVAFAKKAVPRGFDERAVRKTGCQHARMTRRKRDTRALLKLIEHSEERSPLFWWMVEHHDDMLATAHGKRIRWAPVCLKLAALGLVDTRGLAPTERNARETWLQARKAVAAARAAAKPPRPKPPSRFPKDWSPTVLREQEIPIPAYLKPPGTGVVSIPSPPEPALPALQEAEAGRPARGSKEAVLAQMERADWYLLGGTRKPSSAT